MYKDGMDIAKKEALASPIPIKNMQMPKFLNSLGMAPARFAQSKLGEITILGLREAPSSSRFPRNILNLLRFQR